MTGMEADNGELRKAVALRYEQGLDEAPTVVAAGQGFVADRLLAIAREAGVPVESNPELADALASVRVGTSIPEDLYPVVAELLVFVSRMNQLRGKVLGGAM